MGSERWNGVKRKERRRLNGMERLAVWLGEWRVWFAGFIRWSWEFSEATHRRHGDQEAWSAAHDEDVSCLRYYAASAVDMSMGYLRGMRHRRTVSIQITPLLGPTALRPNPPPPRSNYPRPKTCSGWRESKHAHCNDMYIMSKTCDRTSR